MYVAKAEPIHFRHRTLSTKHIGHIVYSILDHTTVVPRIHFNNVYRSLVA